jgi:hypothetical protein
MAEIVQPKKNPTTALVKCNWSHDQTIKARLRIFAFMWVPFGKPYLFQDCIPESEVKVPSLRLQPAPRGDLA